MAGLSIPTEDALEQWVLEILAELGLDAGARPGHRAG